MGAPCSTCRIGWSAQKSKTKDQMPRSCFTCFLHVEGPKPQVHLHRQAQERLGLQGTTCFVRHLMPLCGRSATHMF